MTSIKVAKSSGFCPGVSRAARLIEEETARVKPIFTIGELIHNADYVRHLETMGAHAADLRTVLGMPVGTRVVIRTHGIPREDEAALDAAGLSVLDATCLFVKKIHETADRYTRGGEALFIMGDEHHPEVLGIRSYAHGESYVFPSAKALERFFAELDEEKKADFGQNAPVLVSQTTFSVAEWKNSQTFFKKLYTNAKIFDTICSVTEQRQKEAASLAECSDLVLVVGGRNSSNTRKLLQTAARYSTAVHIENAAELEAAIAETGISALNNIAITAGASTPFSIIQEVTEHMADIIQNSAEEVVEQSFEEMLDKSFKTLHTGERVCGTVSAVTPTEIHFDLGTKHTGILPYDEITDESGVDLGEMFKVGDTVEVVPTKFNDAEGTVMLSKKRLDSSKNWALIVDAESEHAILQGVVKEVVKGGVVVSCNNVRVFVPASQTGIPKDQPLDPLKGKKVSIKIIEINEQRQRAVGSIKLAERSERKKAAEEFLASLEVGQKFTGTIRSLTSYGAFVNIGPVDGMAHITELSWGRLKPPAELFKVGDQIDVYIKSINLEKKRISLGYKTEENNPWNIFLANYKVGDDIKVKVVSIMPFGAFAEILPGVDGLIHNSQLAAKPVASAASVVNVGDEVEVKILAVDEERKRISLSRRALLSAEELGDGFEIVDEAAQEAEPTESAE